MLNRLDFHRLLHTGTEGDVEFYASRVEGARRVLEVGSGMNRLTHTLARHAAAVVGLESDPERLAYARLSKPANVELVLGDIRSLSDAGEFDRILLPYNVVYCLEGTEGLTAALERARTHLAVGGEVWLDFYPMDDFHELAELGDAPPDDDEPIAELEHDGQSYQIFESSEHDLDRRLLRVAYQAVDARGRVAMTHGEEHWYFLTADLERALTDAGLSAFARYGDFHGGAVTEESEHRIFGAVRAGR